MNKMEYEIEGAVIHGAIMMGNTVKITMRDGGSFETKPIEKVRAFGKIIIAEDENAVYYLKNCTQNI